MRLCEEGHEEICFVSRRCPLCAVIEEANALERQLAEAETALRAEPGDEASVV